jgi:hypothetical protein
VPVAASDIQYRFSTTSGSQGNSTAATAAGSLGRYMGNSSSTITDASLHNLFDAVSGAENAASDVEYRCFFIYNGHATLVWQNVGVYIDTQTAGGASIAIGLDPAGVTANNSVSAQGAQIANESSAPSGVTFSTPAVGTPLSVGNVAALSGFAVWVRRTAANSAALTNDGGVIVATGETAQ